MHQTVEPRNIDELRIVPGNIELAGAVHVNASSRGGGQRAMTQSHKFRTSHITCAGVCKNLLRLEIQKTQTHRAMTEDSFQMPASAASAQTLFWIQCHHRVAAFPHSVAPRITPETDAIPKCPYANEFFQFVARGSASRRHGVRVIENTHRS